MRKTISYSCLLLLTVVTYAQPYLPAPGTMDKYTFFVFSHYWLTVADTQIFYVSPDMSIRGWTKWDRDGTKPSDYNFSIISKYHQWNMPFIGGMTTTVYFLDEAKDSFNLRT